MAASDPNCRDAAEDLVAILRHLRELKLITSPVSDEHVTRSLRLCQPCRGKRPSPRKCRGWRGSFHEGSAVVIPFARDKNEVVATVSGKFSFERRTAPKKLTEWQLAPAASATFSIEIRKAVDDELCARHHIDLANPDQVGPVWHLQLGGLAAGDRRDRELEWLDVPRWPALPMDMILVLELAIYNFRNEYWRKLRASNPWRDIVKRSEQAWGPVWELRSRAVLLRGPHDGPRGPRTCCERVDRSGRPLTFSSLSASIFVNDGGGGSPSGSRARDDPRHHQGSWWRR